MSTHKWVCYTSKIHMILGRILLLIKLLAKIPFKPGNWFFWSSNCSIFNIHSSINQVLNGLGIKHICFCKQDNNRNCAQTQKLKFNRLWIAYTPLPVPHSLKKFNSALVIGLASLLIGMQYLHRMHSDALWYYHLITYQMTCRWSLRDLLVEHFCTKSLTLSSSDVLPASKPRESWKTNPILLSNLISFSISCSPLCHPSVKCNREYRSTLLVQLDWARTSQPIHINNDWWWCLEYGIPHGPPDWKFSAALLYCKLAGGWLSSPHWRGQWWGHENAWWTFGHFLLVSVVFLYPLLLGIWYQKETFVAGCLRWWKWWWIKISAAGNVSFGYAGSGTKGVTSLTHLHARSSSETSFIHSYNFIPFTQPLYTHVIDPSTELFKSQPAHDDREHTQVCRQIWPLQDH